MFFFCYIFVLTLSFHKEEFIPSVKLQSGYADWKMSPEPPPASGAEQKMGETAILGEQTLLNWRETKIRTCVFLYLGFFFSSGWE